MLTFWGCSILFIVLITFLIQWLPLLFLLPPKRCLPLHSCSICIRHAFFLWLLLLLLLAFLSMWVAILLPVLLVFLAWSVELIPKCRSVAWAILSWESSIFLVWIALRVEKCLVLAHFPCPFFNPGAWTMFTCHLDLMNTMELWKYTVHERICCPLQNSLACLPTSPLATETFSLKLLQTFL